jgi:hypothetical protein
VLKAAYRDMTTIITIIAETADRMPINQRISEDDTQRVISESLMVLLDDRS